MGWPSRVALLEAGTGALFAKHCVPTVCGISETISINRAVLDSRPISRPKGRDFVSNHMASTTCRENKARTEVPEECCENGGLGRFDDDRRDTSKTRSAVPVRFYRSPTETGMKTKPRSQSKPRLTRFPAAWEIHAFRREWMGNSAPLRFPRTEQDRASPDQD